MMMIIMIIIIIIFFIITAYRQNAGTILMKENGSLMMVFLF